jgi:hypothetical protein
VQIIDSHVRILIDGKLASEEMENKDTSCGKVKALVKCLHSDIKSSSNITVKYIRGIKAITKFELLPASN